MKLGMPIAIVAFGAVIVSVLALALNFSKQPKDTLMAQPVAQARPAAARPRTRPVPSGVNAIATSRPSEASSHSHSQTPLQRAQQEATERKCYLIALFLDPDAPQSKTVQEEISKAVQKEYSDRMDIFEVPVTEPQHQATVRQLGIFTTPFVLVFAPTGAVTHHFQEFADISAELAKAVLSPKTEEILAGLQERKVVFVYVSEAQGAMDQQNRAELEGMTRILSASVRSVYIQNDAPAEQDLLREIMKLDPAKDAPVVVVIAKSGAIVEKIPGKLTRETLLKAFRKVLVSRSGCGGKGSGPGGGTCQ